MNNANKIIAGALALALGASVAVGVTQIIDHREDIKNKYNEVKEQITHKQELDDANAQIETLTEEKAEAEEALATSRARIGELESVVTQKTTALTQANATIAEQLATITAQATQIDNLTAFKFGKYINIENDTVIEILNNGKVKLYEDAENFELLDYTVEDNIITVEVDNEEMQFEITSNMSVENTVGEDTYTFVYLTEELEDAVNSRNLLQSDLATAQSQLNTLNSQLSTYNSIVSNLDNFELTVKDNCIKLSLNVFDSEGNKVTTISNIDFYSGVSMSSYNKLYNYLSDSDNYTFNINNTSSYLTRVIVMQYNLDNNQRKITTNIPCLEFESGYVNYDDIDNNVTYTFDVGSQAELVIKNVNNETIKLNEYVVLYAGRDNIYFENEFEYYSINEIDEMIEDTLTNKYGISNPIKTIEWSDGTYHYADENNYHVVKKFIITIHEVNEAAIGSGTDIGD